MRLFVAIEIEAAIREALTRAIEGLARTGADVRWIPPENLHLTMKFCGELKEFEPLSAALVGEVKGFAPVDIDVAGMGRFPDRGDPRIVWAGCRGDLAGLAAACERAAERVGVARERRPFSGHITLGRVRSTRGWKALSEPIRAGGSFGRMKVECLTLFRSRPEQDGATYDAVGRIPLKSSA